jgi:hypothetical protein
MENVTSRLEWYSRLNPANAPKTTEETKFHRKVRMDQRVLPYPKKS